MERKTHKENIGHVSGGVHKGEINKEEAKDVKEEEVPRLERRQRKWEVVGNSCLAFKTSCFHNVYNKPTLFPGVVFI